MQIYLLGEGGAIGPLEMQEVLSRIESGTLSRGDMGWYEGSPDWMPLYSIPGLLPGPPALVHNRTPQRDSVSQQSFLRTISDYEKISAILWFCLAILQILSLVALIAGVWNIFAAVSRLDASKRILRRDPKIPKDYEGIAQLVVIAVINLFAGGVVGIIFVAFDFYIRDLVLKNAHLFKPAEDTGGCDLREMDQGGITNLGKGHSKLGIASFVISLTAVIVIFFLLLISAITNPSGSATNGSASDEILGLILLTFLLATFAAFLIGLVSLFDRSRNRIFPVMGTLFSGLILLVTVILLTVGALME